VTGKRCGIRRSLSRHACCVQEMTSPWTQCHEEGS
jgi:hypothetical protein